MSGVKRYFLAENGEDKTDQQLLEGDPGYQDFLDKMNEKISEDVEKADFEGEERR